ncbi:hypothetical protein ACFOG5_01165 [Pedobacter fastidiosus]|uniref:Uncharacterized protein n=1 Tax=Pedobacter fastidiosus TaxID=2765361 RepID=A0ABR7KS66_9SPHI|nr:hypothetical protein [Pedobacter fastidiosus]MBC6110940.1 hypothetical protein [Pedobacter fastidiosus]
MQPSEKDNPEDHSIDLARIYLRSRLAVLNWISSRYLLIELSKQLTLWPYMALMLYAKRILGISKK